MLHKVSWIDHTLKAAAWILILIFHLSWVLVLKLYQNVPIGLLTLTVFGISLFIVSHVRIAIKEYQDRV